IRMCYPRSAITATNLSWSLASAGRRCYTAAEKEEAIERGHNARKGQTMPQNERGLQLRCRDGHFEMASFEVQRHGDGFCVWVACELDGHAGGHWLAPDPQRSDAFVVTSTPYEWPTATGAYEARDRWAAQNEG